ncbi:MAG: hypothetical protein ACN0LA_07820 [Candidatus Longimicrobiales bacterium M2_2A_002]
MRKSILLPLLLVACAGDTGDAAYRVIPDFVDRSTPIACQEVDLGDVAVEALRSATDSTFLVLDAAQRRITEYDDRLRQRWTLDYLERGPAAVDRPIAAGLLGDSAVAILARGGLKLLVLARDGRLLRSQRLEFIPHSLATANDEVLVTAMPMGETPGSLLFRYRNGRLESVPIPRREYTDMMIGGLGNSALVETFPDGAALVVHQILAPRAFHVSSDRRRVSVLEVPTPDATAHLVQNVPRAPVTEAQFDHMLLPAMALSLDRAAGEAYLLTRSGRTVNGRRERAILRTDADLGFLGGYLLDVNAVHMAILPRRGAALVVDDMDRFHLCPLRESSAAE